LKARLAGYLGFVVVIFLFQNCTTKKNTVIHRGYHNLTARYNGYYYSSESIKEGVYKIEKNNKENYEKVLPVFILPTNENAKSTFPDFDKAIKKSSLVIQRHTIRDKKENEIPTAGKWIDNNWINIGISHFYKREFFSGIEAFDYVARTYKTKDKHKALLWAAKTYNEIGAVSQADPIIGLLQNDKKVSPKIKKQIYAVKADYYIKRGLNKEAIEALTQAVNQNGFNGIKKKTRARYAFIIAQLYEQEKEEKKARQYYQKAISMKPSYDMVFYANIKLAKLVDVKNSNPGPVKKKLLKMTRDEKNAEYLDVIFFTLGEIEEKEQHLDQAIVYFKKSAQNSVSNMNQKALAYLKLGEIYFDKTNYQESGAYYDSTIATLPKDHPDYTSIMNRKQTLETLVGYIQTIQRQDSLLKLANMPESDRNRAIDKIIARIEEEEQRKKDEIENALSQNQNPNLNSPSNPGNQLAAGTGGGTWYFYNQTTISFGISDFNKKWGQRKLEDNWRRSQKNLTLDNFTEKPDEIDPGNGKKTVLIGAKDGDPRKTREYYLTQLPLTDSLKRVANEKIIEAEYLLGATYKEDLNNNRKAILAFEDLNNRYTDHKHRLSAYYQLYRLYAAERNQAQSDFYKEKLLSEYPNSEYAKLIKNPKYAEERNSQRSEVEKVYTSTFDAFSAGDYNTAYQQSTEAFTKFGKTDFTPKFEFIRAMSAGRLKGIDTLEAGLKEFVVLYPKSDLVPRANEVLLAIKKQKDPNLFSGQNLNTQATDTFKINFDAAHFILVISPDDPKIANPFKTAVDEFNRTFYANKEFSISSNLFATNQQMIIVKSFTNARDANSYLENMKNDAKIFSGGIKKETFSFFTISAENLPVFYKKANVNSYRAFYDEAYKTIVNLPNK
jgi:tetratricopeptide (TPR) repeat protein